MNIYSLLKSVNTCFYFFSKFFTFFYFFDFFQFYGNTSSAGRLAGKTSSRTRTAQPPPPDKCCSPIHNSQFTIHNSQFLIRRRRWAYAGRIGGARPQGSVAVRRSLARRRDAMEAHAGTPQSLTAQVEPPAKPQPARQNFFSFFYDFLIWSFWRWFWSLRLRLFTERF